MRPSASSPRDRLAPSVERTIWWSSIAFTLYLLLVATGAFRPLGEGMLFVLRPIQRASADATLRAAGFFDRFRSSPDLSRELTRLKEDNQRLTVENAQLREQIENSKDIQTQLSFLAPRSLSAVFAQVIGKSPLPDQETILLDRGSADGVQRGAPLIVGEGVYIGRIQIVSSYTSVAILATDSDHRVAALLQNADRSPGEVIGERGLGMRIDLIPREDEFAVGDTVVTSGLDPSVPEGLVIGRIARTTTKTGDLFHSADVEQTAVPSRLRIAAILLTPHE